MYYYSLPYTWYQIFYVKNTIMKNIHQHNSHHVKREIRSAKTLQSTSDFCASIRPRMPNKCLFTVLTPHQVHKIGILLIKKTEYFKYALKLNTHSSLQSHWLHQLRNLWRHGVAKFIVKLPYSTTLQSALCILVTYGYYYPFLHSPMQTAFTDCLVHQAVHHIHHKLGNYKVVVALAAVGVVGRLWGENSTNQQVLDTENMNPPNMKVEVNQDCSKFQRPLLNTEKILRSNAASVESNRNKPKKCWGNTATEDNTILTLWRPPSIALWPEETKKHMHYQFIIYKNSEN